MDFCMLVRMLSASLPFNTPPALSLSGVGFSADPLFIYPGLEFGLRCGSAVLNPFTKSQPGTGWLFGNWSQPFFFSSQTLYH